MEKKQLIFNIAILALLLVSIGMQVFNGGGNSIKSPQAYIEEKRQVEEYMKDIGKKNIVIENDKKVKSDYSTSIIGTVKNTSNKTAKDVYIMIYLYNSNNKVTDYAVESIPEIPANGSMDMEAYVGSKEFDSYAIEYITCTLE